MNALVLRDPASRPARVVDRLLDLLLMGCLLGAPLIFYTRGYDVFEYNKITALRVLCSLAAFLLLYKLLAVRPLRLTRSALDLPVAAWLLVAVLCTVNTVNRRLSVHGVFEDFEGITTWCMYAFLFWWTLQHVRSERQIRLVLGTIVLAGTVAGFYGLLQNFGIDFVPWNPDTYNPNRMFSTMGNPNFLAAYTVMSMPITFAIFLDLPDKIRTDKAFCALLVVMGLLASIGACLLFKVNYLDFKPASFGAESVGGMLVSLKFWTTKALLIFPLVCALLLYGGRLRWILLLSLLGQIVSTFFTKSRGGSFSMLALFLVFGSAIGWELARLKGIITLLALLALGALSFQTGFWEPVFKAAFVDHYWPATAVFALVLWGFYALCKRSGSKSFLMNSLGYLVLLVALVWLLMGVSQVRQTVYEMLERTSKLFHPTEVRYTPRLFIWKSAIAMMRDHFWLGTGLDTFQISFPPYREAIYWNLEWNGTPEKAHNFIMQTAATMGFLGLLAFAWMHFAFIRSSLRDWLGQADERKRMLLLACFCAWLAFFTQNLFNFTVVGYGSLWWVLWGLLPAMQRTWQGPSAPAQDPVGSPGQAPLAAPEGRWSSPRWAWSAGLFFLAGMLCTTALAGPTFFVGQGVWVLRLLAALCGLAGLAWLLWAGPWAPRRLPALALLMATGLGMLFYSWYSVRVWVADSYYKMGQIGMNSDQPLYAAAMFQKAAGRLAMIDPAKLRSLLEPVAPEAAEQRLAIEPGLNPDQELYWVKLGIALETAAAGATKPEEKMGLYQSALAVHQYTLEMNPINGYNFNNKGRVLKSMGEAFNDAGAMQKALEHYDKAIAVDVNNVYFNIDKANTLLNLGRAADALDVLGGITQKFPDFAMPYSYIGYIQMRLGDKKGATENFERAVRLDWKRDVGSRALAATNLAMLYADAKRWDDAEHAYGVAIEANPRLPEPYVKLGELQFKRGRRAQGIQVLRAVLQHYPNYQPAVDLLKREGLQP